MSKNLSVFVTNNLISIAVHVCMCVAFIFPLRFLSNIGYVGGERIIWFAIGSYTLIALFLYFLAGKTLLHDTENRLANILSVIGFAAILLAAVYFAYDAGWGSFLIMTFCPLGGAIPSYFEIEEKQCYLALSLLPALMMLTGILATKTDYNSPFFNADKKKIFFIFLIALLGLISSLIMFLFGVSVFEEALIFIILFLLLLGVNIVFLNRHPSFYVFSKNNILTKTIRTSFLLYLSILFSFLAIIISDYFFSEIIFSYIEVEYPVSEVFIFLLSVVLDAVFLKLFLALFLKYGNRRVLYFDPE